MTGGHAKGATERDNVSFSIDREAVVVGGYRPLALY